MRAAVARGRLRSPEKAPQKKHLGAVGLFNQLKTHAATWPTIPHLPKREFLGTPRSEGRMAQPFTASWAARRRTSVTTPPLNTPASPAHHECSDSDDDGSETSSLSDATKALFSPVSADLLTSIVIFGADGGALAPAARLAGIALSLVWPRVPQISPERRSCPQSSTCGGASCCRATSCCSAMRAMRSTTSGSAGPSSTASTTPRSRRASARSSCSACTTRAASLATRWPSASC